MIKAFVLLLCLVPALPVMAGDLTARTAWIRLLPGDLPLGGYFELHNGGKRPVTLTGASSPAFREIQMHKSVSRNGSESMQRVTDIAVSPGTSLHFAPGGYHLMMFDRTHSLKVGDEVRVRLELSGGQPAMTVRFVVKPATEQ